MNINKTLIGKDNYLFLQNDSGKELEVHNNNLCLVANNFYIKFNSIKYKYLLIVFPNKSYIYKNYLPDNFELKYRPAFNLYKNYLEDHILDGYIILESYNDTYYKTDSHINLYGNYIIYNSFIDKVNFLFKLNIQKNNINILKKECNNLTDLHIGIGDLTWSSNLGTQKLNDTTDNYYYTHDFNTIFLNYIINTNEDIKLLFYSKEINNLIDETDKNLNNKIDWIIISKYILYKKNKDKKYKVLIFYDSFLLNILPLYLEMFSDVYLCKSKYYLDLINCIDPDFIFEFRVERFLI